MQHPTDPQLHGVKRVLAVLLGVCTYGTAGYMVIEHFDFLDAVFMTVISITTVGYEEVHPLDSAGKVFTITLILFGVIGFLYTFGVLVEQLSSGRWSAYRRFRRMDAQLRALHDHVIVCGYGRTGAQVVRQLLASGSPYVVIELNPAPLEHVERDQRLHVVGDAASDDVLRRAGIERARALISAVDSDERNVYIVLTARALNPTISIVARSSYPESVEKLRRAGADRVLSPYTLSGSRMADLALQPAVVDVIEMVMAEGGSGGMAIEELVVPRGMDTPITTGELRRSGAVLLAVRSMSGTLSVGPDDAQQLQADDLIVAMGTRAQLADMAHTLRPSVVR